MADLRILKLTYSPPGTPMCYFRLLTFEVIGGSFDEMLALTDKLTARNNKYTRQYSSGEVYEKKAATLHVCSLFIQSK